MCAWYLICHVPNPVSHNVNCLKLFSFCLRSEFQWIYYWNNFGSVFHKDLGPPKHANILMAPLVFLAALAALYLPLVFVGVSPTFSNFFSSTLSNFSPTFSQIFPNFFLQFLQLFSMFFLHFFLNFFNSIWLKTIILWCQGSFAQCFLWFPLTE